MDQKIPYSWCCSVNPLVNEGIIFPLQLTQEKEKSSVDRSFTGCFKFFLLECVVPIETEIQAKKFM